ncbi:hypothetical protein LTR53_007551 [Teratosphaeriaceae sp. CCFEE 6253]|nr:hypothetical protein LTR53_007551 [Teratosphaeriaceae sp. CCFEE 6253]
MHPSTRRVAPLHLSRALTGAVVGAARRPRQCIVAYWLQSRHLTAATAPSQEAIPLRKHLKDEAKRKKSDAKGQSNKTSPDDPRLQKWELTVGIEIHAELNTACKLFSPAPAEATEASDGGSPNSRVALFDAAMPGTQPQFQVATLLPALRAAIALGCEVQHISGWDRKHYFHWDQPNGYQITQYYQPFAKNGTLSLSASDGVPSSDLNGAEHIEIGIKQIQMEQDTAKTSNVGSSTYHVDYNRAGVPLIEIITLPQIHTPQTASAVVRKIQAVLRSVDACVIGMELGGLRADVNVSVRQRGTSGVGSSYSGVGGLGQRTEIKNLSSFKAVEDAILAERDRQIGVLEAGGVIEGETRGWTLGATETTRLRGKEGEVDYRYMPDADLPPLVIGQDLVQHLRDTLPTLPAALESQLQDWYGLSLKDAKSLIDLDDGDRLDFFERTRKTGKTVGNWVLHELGGLLTTHERAWADVRITADELKDILLCLRRNEITARVAKQLLADLLQYPPPPAGPYWPSMDNRPTVDQLIEAGNLRLRPLSEEGYEDLAKGIMEANPEMVKAVREKGQRGKIMWFVGQMVRRGEEGTVEPGNAREVVERLMGD